MASPDSGRLLLAAPVTVAAGVLGAAAEAFGGAAELPEATLAAPLIATAAVEGGGEPATTLVAGGVAFATANGAVTGIAAGGAMVAPALTGAAAAFDAVGVGTVLLTAFICACISSTQVRHASIVSPFKTT